MKWTKWHDYQGARHMGSNRYTPPKPWGPWTKIMGVVARCEGNHDTCVSYDNTGMTWGYLQWTFTSGRLQKLLQSMKSLFDYDFDSDFEGVEQLTLFEEHFIKGQTQVFEKFGFRIESGYFCEILEDGSNKRLIPNLKKNRQRISDICMGRVKYKKFAKQKQHAMDLAEIFATAGQDEDAAFAQIEFAKNEFKRCLPITRRPLKEHETIANLLDGTWDTPIPALFFNLWQNSPAGTYRLFLNEYRLTGRKDPDTFFEGLWSRLNRNKYANWSYAKPENKVPRIRRIKKAMGEFYGLDLPVSRY